MAGTRVFGRRPCGGPGRDPDVLDPSLARTYVGRIVFAALCDKLFDIDDKLNIVPQLALSHETSADGKTVTIRLRPGVKFHDGEAMDAEAVKASLERHMTMQGSFRKPELAAVDKVEVADASTVRVQLKNPFSPLMAQLADRAGMIVSPKAAAESGDKFGLKPVCAGPFKFVERVQQDRIVARNSPIWTSPTCISTASSSGDRGIDRRLANLKSVSLDLSSARSHRPQVDQGRSKLKLATQNRDRLPGLTPSRQRDAGRTPLRQGPGVRQALERQSIARRFRRRLQRRGVPGNQWVSPKPYFQQNTRCRA